MPTTSTLPAVSRALPDPVFRAILRTGERVLRWTLTRYFRVETHGLESLAVCRPAIVASNHPSLLDGLLLHLLSPVPVRFVAHRELFRHPLIGWLMRGMGFINAAHHRQALSEAEAALQRGEVLAVFPEGAAYECGRMDHVHQGVALLALRTGAAVVPMGIAGAAEALPLGTYLPRPRRIALHIGSPFCYADSPMERGERVSDGAIVGVLVDLRRHILDLRDAARDALTRPLPPRVSRPIEVVLSALILLPIVAILTATAHELDPTE